MNHLGADADVLLGVPAELKSKALASRFKILKIKLTWSASTMASYRRSALPQ
jgi:hypothetical protein